MKPHAYSFSTTRHPEPTTFGEYIRKARREKGLRQKDVARATGVDEMTVVNWKGYRSVPLRGRAQVVKLCEVLGLDFEVIAG